MSVVRDKEYFYVVFEGKKIYKSHLRLDCVQYIYAKKVERRKEGC